MHTVILTCLYKYYSNIVTLSCSLSPPIYNVWNWCMQCSVQMEGNTWIEAIYELFMNKIIFSYEHLKKLSGNTGYSSNNA